MASCKRYRKPDSCPWPLMIRSSCLRFWGFGNSQVTALVADLLGGRSKGDERSKWLLDFHSGKEIVQRPASPCQVEQKKWINHWVLRWVGYFLGVLCFANISVHIPWSHLIGVILKCREHLIYKSQYIFERVEKAFCFLCWLAIPLSPIMQSKKKKKRRIKNAGAYTKPKNPSSSKKLIEIPRCKRACKAFHCVGLSLISGDQNDTESNAESVIL